jgi:hypothetical protein
VHCSQSDELEDELPEVEEADEIVMEVLEEETGLHPQHAPSQDVTPQVPLHVETYPGQHSRMRCTHMRSRMALSQIVCPGSH